jgi:hypothetical protein
MRSIFFTIVFLIGTTQLWAIDFNDKQKAIIYNEAIKLLKSYQDLNNQMADAVVDMDEVNKTSQKMIDLFVNRKAIIYNDLDPNHKMSEVFELETYVTNLLLWYPDGMKISIDFNNLKAGNIIDHGEAIFTVDLMTSKTNNGNYLNRQKNELKEELLYRIAFFQKENTFESFKIAGIRSSSSNLKTNDDHLLAEVKSVEFTPKEMQLIQEQTKSLMNDYINFINLLSDPNETLEDKGYYKISFLGLFKDSTLKVANDIEPNPQNRWISVTKYQENLVSSYPDGIKNLGLNIDSAEYSKVIPEGNNRYYINGYIDKFFSGKFQNKTIYRDNAKYDFKVSFEKDENTFKNFKLSSIDKFGVNLYEQKDSESAPALPTKPISSLKRSGLYLGTSMGAGKTMYSNPDLSNDATLVWDIQNKSALSIEANATWYFQNQLGAKIGLAYQRFSSATNLTGDFWYNSYFIDINDEPYLKNITATYDSVVNYNYLSIPITLIYHSNKNPETWGFYCEVGLVTSILLNANYQTTGNFSSTGYYEQYPEAMQIISDPKWGFITRTQIDEKGKADAKSLHFSATASCGFSYPLDYFTTLYFGPEIVWGLSNISNNSDFIDAFGNKTTAQKVGISKYGIKFGINYKF